MLNPGYRHMEEDIFHWKEALMWIYLNVKHG